MKALSLFSIKLLCICNLITREDGSKGRNNSHPMEWIQVKPKHSSNFRKNQKLEEQNIKEGGVKVGA